jgi:hypothetical protein
MGYSNIVKGHCNPDHQALAGYANAHRSSGSDTALVECTKPAKASSPSVIVIRDDSWIDLIVAAPGFIRKLL